MFATSGIIEARTQLAETDQERTEEPPVETSAGSAVKLMTLQGGRAVSAEPGTSLPGELKKLKAKIAMTAMMSVRYAFLF